jgi:hypothetical protein
MPFEDEYEEREYLDSWHDDWEEKELQPVVEEREEMLEILRGIVNNAKYYKHGVWTVTWEQIEKAKKKVEEWDE